VPGPKIVSIVDGNETTALTAADLQAMGFQVVLFAMTALFTATQAVADALAQLKTAGTPRGSGRQISYADYSALVDLPFHQRLDERFGQA
jgi:2-methylisocitrate lyase-like PEP mutase family enzyme